MLTSFLLIGSFYDMIFLWKDYLKRKVSFIKHVIFSSGKQRHYVRVLSENCPVFIKAVRTEVMSSISSIIVELEEKSPKQ